MLDTTVFNHILRDDIDIEQLPSDKPLFATHVQLNEIQNTKDEIIRSQLLAVFTEVEANRVATSSAVWDVSEWGEAEWGTNDGLFENLLQKLNSLNKNKKNNARDILIGETAIRHGMTLVTDDADLTTTINEFGGKVVALKEFLGK
jgi:hypothetical protein